MLEKIEEQNLKNRFFNFFGSTYTAVFFLVLGVIGYAFELSAALVAVYAAALILTLIFCEDVKNIFAYIFYVPFFIVSISAKDEIWNVYIPCVALAVFSIILFLIFKLITEREKINFGKMFFPMIAFTVAMALGGAAGRFNISAFFVFLGFGFIIYVLYLIAYNYTKNFSEFLAVVFVVGAVFIFLCTLIYYEKEGKTWLTDSPLFFAAENFNTAAIFITLGIAGCLYLGMGKKYDYLYLFLSAFLFFIEFTTRCRTMTLIAAILFLAEYVLFFVYSDKKRLFLCLTIFLIAMAVVCFLLIYPSIKDFIADYVSKDNRGLNGRDILWRWCVEKFNEYPYLGYGYVSDTPIPFIFSFYPTLVMAHNTVLQWITATGVVGTSIAVYFYLGKYYALFSGFNKNRIFHLLSVLAIALSGAFDQSPTMDIFVVVASITLIAAAEKTVKNQDFALKSF